MGELRIAEPEDISDTSEAIWRSKVNTWSPFWRPNIRRSLGSSHILEFLERSGLVKIVEAAKSEGRRKISVWSAACSRAQEVYSPRHVSAFHLRQRSWRWVLKILASDVDAHSVAYASKWRLFHWWALKIFPSIYMGTNWLKGTGEISDFVKAKASSQGFMPFSSHQSLRHSISTSSQKFWSYFLQNVFIYFALSRLRKLSLESFEFTAPWLFFHWPSQRIFRFGFTYSFSRIFYFSTTSSKKNGVHWRGANPVREINPDSSARVIV